MLKGTIVAATLLAMAWALPAWANDSDDCLKGETLVKTAPDRVFAACSRLAEQNVPGAQNRLGIMYDDGLGVRQDYAAAAKWYGMAAALGDAEAELNLARMYSTGHGVPRDDVEAAKWLRRAADQGRVVAQTVLAAMYIAGRGVVKSDTEAVTWERKAADQGYAAAQSMLGSAYQEGKGAPQSDAEAARWLRLVHAGLRCRDYAAHLMTPAQIAQAEALAAAKTGQ